MECKLIVEIVINGVKIMMSIQLKKKVSYYIFISIIVLDAIFKNQKEDAGWGDQSMK